MGNRSADRFKRGIRPSTEAQPIEGEARQRQEAEEAARLERVQAAMAKADREAGTAAAAVEQLRQACRKYLEEPSPAHLVQLRTAVQAHDGSTKRWTDIFNAEMKEG